MKNIFKNKLTCFLFEELCIFNYYSCSLFYGKKINIFDNMNTIHYLIENKKSFARFGDGEFDIINEGKIGFQEYDSELAKELKLVLNETKCENLLLGIPDAFASTDELKKSSKRFWQYNLGKNYFKWIKYLDFNYNYGSANAFRCYMRCKNDSLVEKQFACVKELWGNPEGCILIVEGKGTRMGYNSDFFDETLDIKRILCPTENAFSKINDIENAIIEFCKYNLVHIVLVSLGPTATILAAKISKKGIWIIDIGAVDLEYEYYKRKWKNGGNLDYKYIDHEGNRGFTDINEDCYLSQIVKRID